MIASILDSVARVAKVSDHQVSDSKQLKIINSKQMLQTLTIALVQLKTDNTSENLLNEIRQIIHSLYQAREIIKNLYNSIMNLIKLQNRLDTIFMNSKISGTSDPHRLLLNLSDKRNLKRSNEYVASSKRSIYYTWKNIKKSCKNNKFKISAPTWNKELKLPDGPYSVSDVQDYFVGILKKHGENTNNLTIYVNKIKNKITFRIKTEYHLEPLTPETIKLFGAT